MRFIDDQLGKILLILAIGIGGAYVVLNPAQPLQNVPDELVARPVKVVLDQTKLARESPEIFYAADGRDYTEPAKRFVFVPEREIFVFQPIDLDLPTAAIQRPPRLLPEIAPTLDGTGTLPRFGDELPSIISSAPAGASAIPSTGFSSGTRSTLPPTPAPANAPKAAEPISRPPPNPFVVPETKEPAGKAK